MYSTNKVAQFTLLWQYIDGVCSSVEYIDKSLNKISERETTEKLFLYEYVDKYYVLTSLLVNITHISDF